MTTPPIKNPSSRSALARLLRRRSILGVVIGGGAGAVAGASSAAFATPGSGDTVRLGSNTRSLSDKLSEALSIEDFGADPRAADNKAAIESAIRAALTDGRSVFVPAGTYAYSQLELGRNDAVEPVRLVISGPGTLRSTFRGTSIVASKGPFYDLVLDGLRFESQAGAGTTLIDGDRFIRLILTPGTQIDGFDWVVRGTNYLQSIRMLGIIVRGGRGAVVKAPQAFDCTFAHNIIEFVTDGIVIDGPEDPAVNTCRIADNIIEGIGGRAIVLGTCLSTAVSGNYLEGNYAADILLNAGQSPHKGLRVQDNSIQMSSRRRDNGDYAIVWGRATALPVRSGGNFSTGRLHDTAGATAIIDMTGDFSQIELYRGYRPETQAKRAPIGRAIYSDGLAHHFAWFDRHLTIDPYHNEIRFGGRHRSQVKDSVEAPTLSFGTVSPAAQPTAFDRKRWARGSIVFNAEPGDKRPFAWVCRLAGEPGEWAEA